MMNFLNRHVATAALIVELSTLSAVFVFLVANTFGHPTYGFA